MQTVSVASPHSFPLLQARQAKLFEACGLPCVSVGKRLFKGVEVEMFQPTGERREPVASLIGLGGAAFGGKTYGILALAATLAEVWPGVQIAFFRRTYPELDGPGAAIQTAYEMFGGKAKASDGGKEWTWENGSAFYFRHCQNEKDVYSYQSQQIDVLLPDEATHFTWFIVDYLLTRNRASGNVKVPGFRPFAVMPTNPGNVGHAWYSQVFDVNEKHGPHETVKQTVNPNDKTSTVYFIPAYLEDNKIGVANDPEYEARLMQRDPEIANALRRGVWTIFAGQMFPTWSRERVACKSFEIPDHWPKWRALDYGFVHPFAAGWATRNPQTGRIYVYRAVKKSELTDVAQARLIRDMTPQGELVTATYASPDMWARKTKKNVIFTAVDEYKSEGVILTQADNDRKRGVAKLHGLLEEMLDGYPGIQVFEEYFDVFKCMTTLVRDKDNPEDVEKVDGDDAYDMLRYLLTNYNLPAKKQKETPRHPWAGRGNL